MGPWGVPWWGIMGSLDKPKCNWHRSRGSRDVVVVRLSSQFLSDTVINAYRKKHGWPSEEAEVDMSWQSIFPQAGRKYMQLV